MATSASPGLVSMVGFRTVDITRGSEFAKQNRGVRLLASAFPMLPSSSCVAGIAGKGATPSGCRAAISALVPEIHRRPHQRAATGKQAATAAVAQAQVVEGEEQQVPLPVVHIDQLSDPDSTIVELSFGDRLGALLDTTKALKNLGLSVVKAQVTTEASRAKNKFYITRADNGSKVVNPETLEAIRLTVINNLLKYHPESSEQLYLGETFGDTPPKKKLDVDIATHVSVRKVSPKESQLIVETADRPGLLLDIISVLTDINIMVESADINTEGLVAIDKLNLSYGGAALSKSLEQVVVNCLRYHIRKVEVEDDSY